MHVLFTLFQYHIHFPLAGLSFLNISCIMYLLWAHRCFSHSFISCCFKFVLLQLCFNYLTERHVSRITRIRQSQLSSQVRLLNVKHTALPPLFSLLAAELSVEAALFCCLFNTFFFSQDDLGHPIPCLCAGARSLPELIRINYIKELIVWSVSLQKCVWNDLLSGWTKEMKY